MLGRDGHPTPLGQSFAEYGRAAKSLHLLAMCDVDESYWRTVHTQLAVQESRHRWPARSSTASAASYVSPTVPGRKTSCPRSAWCRLIWRVRRILRFVDPGPRLGHGPC